MPVLESTDHITPRSALRHRPIAEDAEKEGKGAKATSSITPVVQRASRLRSKETEEQEKGKDKEKENVSGDVEEWKRTGDDDGVTKRTRASSTQAATATGPKKLPKIPVPSNTASKGSALGKRIGERFAIHAHPLLLLGIGMVIMLALWTLLTLAASWWGNTWNNIQYGYPRTFQVDMVVGHNDSAADPSHFIVINLNGRIEVIEFPGGDASKARIYIGPQLYGNGEQLIPVTLSFVDVNGNHQPDMIIHFQDTRIVYINENGGFRPATPAELQTVEQYLQRHGQ
ncbi:MAG TPA: hypothetical protein VKR83_10280 [Ktedonobacteraceae bacterium]|nr:hypothetical protein [Ktedonobacteraceae bacterium]